MMSFSEILLQNQVVFLSRDRVVGIEPQVFRNKHRAGADTPGILTYTEPDSQHGTRYGKGGLLLWLINMEKTWI
jgi:hypothetical protein